MFVHEYYRAILNDAPRSGINGVSTCPTGQREAELELSALNEMNSDGLHGPVVFNGIPKNGSAGL